jgi:hypothetical protein
MPEFYIESYDTDVVSLYTYWGINRLDAAAVYAKEKYGSNALAVSCDQEKADFSVRLKSPTLEFTHYYFKVEKIEN